MNPKTFFLILTQLALAGSVLILGHYDLGLVAAALVLVVPLWRWWKGGRNNEAFLEVSQQIIMGLSVVGLISLSRPPLGLSVFPVVSQVVLASLYAVWLILHDRIMNHPSKALMAGLSQLLGVSVLFLAAAFWRWPDSLVVGLVWVISFINAWWYFSQYKERSAKLMAAAWALIASQICWVLLNWQVHYVIGDGLIIVPQAAIITAGLGYCIISIYGAHNDKRLSRRRLIEYVAIAGVLLAIVIAGTRWNGTT